MQPEVKPEPELVKIQTERPRLQQYNNQVGEVVGRLRMAKGEYTHVVVRVGNHSQYFDPSELILIQPLHQQLTSPRQSQSTTQTSSLTNSNTSITENYDNSQITINSTPSKAMDEQTKAAADHNRAANEVLADPVENPSLLQDSDRDGLTNYQEVILGTDLESADSDRDGVSDLTEVVVGTDQKSPNPERDNITNPDELLNTTAPHLVDQIEPLPQPSEFKQPRREQDPSTPSLDAGSEQQLLDLPQSPASKPDTPNKNTSQTEQPAFINALYQRLQERSNLDLSNATLIVQQGANPLYQGTFQIAHLNTLTDEQQDVFQKALDDPTGLKGELKINVNGQTIFHIEDGQLKVDSYKLALNQQITEAQPQKQAESANSQSNSQPSFDPSATYNRYQQEGKGESLESATPSAIDAYERIAQKALNDGLSPDEAKQVLKLDPFHQNLALGIGQKEAERYTEHLLNSLGSKSQSNERVTALEKRVEHLSNQVATLTQKIEHLSQSKAFGNNFLGKIRDSISNSWQATKNALRQKAGEVSLSVVNTLAKTTTQWFGEPAKEGLRVIDTHNGQRLGINQQGNVSLTKTPNVKAASEYQRFSQGIDSKLPPSLQVKQIAMAALKERFTPPQIHSILSHAPKVQEITKAQGVNKAKDFTSIAIAAAQRQNAIDAQPKLQLQSQKQNQYQA